MSDLAFGAGAEGSARTLPVTSTAPLDSSVCHIHMPGLTSVGSPHRVILVDTSDVAGFPHDYSGYIHLDWLYIQTDADNQGLYSLQLGFLENVGVAGGDVYKFFHVDATKAAGRVLDRHWQWFPCGPKCHKNRVGTAEITLNDPNYASTTLHKSLIAMASATTPPGSGDLIIEVPVTAGTVDVNLSFGYHTHRHILEF